MKKTLMLIVSIFIFLTATLTLANAVETSGAQKVCGSVTVIQSAPIDIVSTEADRMTIYQGGTWTVTAATITALPSIPAGVNTIGSSTVLGNLGKAIKQDSEGQIYAITAPESGTNLRKSYIFSNIASTDAWVVIGSYTVTTGKSLKISSVEVTGLYALRVKVDDGSTGDEIYLSVAPANPCNSIVDSRPTAKIAGTVITVYAATTETVNAGTISWVGFEY